MDPAIDPKWTVAELLSRVPEARPILNAHGLDACCGGSHPLEFACNAHGIPVPLVLAQIAEARARARRPRPSAPPDARFSPKFLVAALLITLTLGAGSGLFYLWRIGMGADVPISHRQIHAHSQVLGFAALFVMGIAFHVLPRMLGARPAGARLKDAALWLMVSGVLLRNVGQPFAFFGFGRGMSFLSGVLEAASGVLFALWVFAAVTGETDEGARCPTSSAVKLPRDPLRVFLPVGVAFLLAALALNVVQGAWIAAHRDATLPGALTEPFYVAALYGFVLAFVFGFAGRMMPVFLGIAPARRGTFGAAAALLVFGASLATASWVPWLGDAALGVRDAGTLLLSLAALVYVGGIGVLWRPIRAEAKALPGSPVTAIRLAFGSLALWGVLGLVSVAAARFTGLPARNPWWNDAARHVFTIGFLTLLIVGISFRVVPAFSGKALAFPRMARLTWALVVLGAAMRLLQYPGAYRPALYVIGSYMGVPVVLALVLFTVNLVKTVRPVKLAAASAAPGVAPARLVSTLPVR